VPESGDSIQTMKAGLMEIADLFVVNKADRPGADRLRNEVELMLGLRLGQVYKNVPSHHGVDMKRMNPQYAARKAAHADDAGRWTPPVLGTVAAKGEGVDELAAALDRHFDYLGKSGGLRARRRQRLRERVVDAAERQLRLRLWGDGEVTEWLEAQLDALESGARTPFAVAEELLSRNAARVAKSPTDRSPR
jgi:LAO/AO transport system kinase